MKKNSVIITGANSLIGTPLVKIFQDEGYEVHQPSKANMNCLVLQHVYDYFDAVKPDFCVHLAGFNGGISFNQKFPADIYMKTAYMALCVLNAANDHCKKTVSVLPSCAYYPNKRYANDYEYMTEEPAESLKEEFFEDGPPHDSVACHGLAKRILFDYSRQLHKQFKTNAVCCVLNNCYGPGARYNEPDRLKVADSLVKKFVDAEYSGHKNKICCFGTENRYQVKLWGDGSPRRELLYCDDAADGIYNIFQHYNDPTNVINVGSGEDISIKDLAEKIKGLVGFEGPVYWDESKPNGQMKKLFDNAKIVSTIGWKPKVSLDEGLKRTIEWYKNLRGYKDA